MSYCLTCLGSKVIAPFHSPGCEFEEKALAERDERVKAAVLAAIGDAEFEAHMAEEEAKSRRAYARELREACAKEHWWVLKGVVSKETIESLCNVSPSGLLEES